MSPLKRWCNDYPGAEDSLRELFGRQNLDFCNLERIFDECEQAWKANVTRLQKDRILIRYILVAEAAPWTDPSKTPRYFYSTPDGKWAARILKAFDLTESSHQLSDLAKKGFVLLDTLPFAAPYTSPLRRKKSYLELVRHCHPYVKSKLSDLRFDSKPKIALAFTWNGRRVIEAYNGQLPLPDGVNGKISEETIAADGSGYTNILRLKELFGL